MRESFESGLKKLGLFLSHLHLWLARFRVLQVSVALFSCWLCFDCWQFYKSHYSEFDSYTANSGIGLFMVAFLGVLKWAFDSIAKKHEGHDDI